MPARKKKNGNGNGNGNGTNRRMKRKPPINLDHLKTIDPLTDNQTTAFDAYKEGKHLVLHGAAGTGKTFISLYLALQSVLNPETPYVPRKTIWEVKYRSALKKKQILKLNP